MGRLNHLPGKLARQKRRRREQKLTRPLRGHLTQPLAVVRSDGMGSLVMGSTASGATRTKIRREHGILNLWPLSQAARTSQLGAVTRRPRQATDGWQAEDGLKSWQRLKK